MSKLSTIFFIVALAVAREGRGDVGGHLMLDVDLTAGTCTVFRPTTGTEQTAIIETTVKKAGVTLAVDSNDVKALEFVVTRPNFGSIRLAPAATAGTAIQLNGGPSDFGAYRDAQFAIHRGGGAAAITCPGGETWDCPADAVAAATAMLEKPSANDQTITLKTGAISEGWRQGRRTLLVHLPDGHLSGSAPSYLSERDEISVVVLAPKTATVEFNVTSCAAVPIYRRFGAEAAPAGGAALGGAPGARTEMTEVWLAQDRRCAGKLEYKVTITMPGCAPVVDTESFVTAPVYDFQIGAGFGFDTGSPVDYSLENHMSGMTADKIVVRKRDQHGFSPLISLTWYPFGMNFQSWRYRDAFAPFIAFDPTRVTKGAVAGVNWSFPHGIGIVTGLSVYETEKITAPDGTKAGDVLPASASLDTRDTFNSDSLGFYIGVNVTTELMQTFFTAAGRTFGAASGGSGSSSTNPSPAPAPSPATP